MTISAVLLREMFNYNQLEYAQNLFSIVMVHMIVFIQFSCRSMEGRSQG